MAPPYSPEPVLSTRPFGTAQLRRDARARKASGHREPAGSPKLGAADADIERALAVLARAGQVEGRRGRFPVTSIQRVDTRNDPVRARELKVADVHLDDVRAMQAIIAPSSSGGCVGLYCAQLLELHASGENALAEADGHAPGGNGADPPLPSW